jgi:hypothetical protein
LAQALNRIGLKTGYGEGRQASLRPYDARLLASSHL